VAKKRAEGHFDDLSNELIAHIIASERHHLLHEDDEGWFDDDADSLFESVRTQG
jgi:hypothetical protein